MYIHNELQVRGGGENPSLNTQLLSVPQKPYSLILKAILQNVVREL